MISKIIIIISPEKIIIACSYKLNELNSKIFVKKEDKNVTNKAIIIHIVSFFISSRFNSNFSLAANLTTYTNNTIKPPKKIKNKIKENHLVFIIIQIITHISIVCIKIIIKIITGFEEIIILNLTPIEISIKSEITEFSLF